MDEENEITVLGKQEQANLEIFKKIAKGVDNKDIQEFIADYFADDVEIRVWLPDEIPFGGIFRGLEGVQTFLKNFASTFKTEWVRREPIVQGDKIVVIGRERAKIMPHGKIYEADFASVFTFRDGKVSMFQAFVDGVALLKAYRGE
jgi:uncharacterized protein